MREILFKAKRKDNGEWAEGCLIIDYVSGQYFIHQNGNSVNESPKIGEEGCLRFLTFEIDSNTICQYTGLTDKNGKKIWENDICDTFENDSKEMLRNVVKFEDGCFKVFKKYYLSMHLDRYEESDLKVVGNVFDNPKLLEME